MLTNARFSALDQVEGLTSIEQSIKSKTTQAITSENKAVILLDCTRNKSNAFYMQIAEPLFEFCHGLPIPVAMNTTQWKVVPVPWQMFLILWVMQNVRIFSG